MDVQSSPLLKGAAPPASTRGSPVQTQRSPEVVCAACRPLLHRLFAHAAVRRQTVHLHCGVCGGVVRWLSARGTLLLRCSVSFAVAVAGTLRSTGHAFRSSQLGKKLITPRERAFFLERLTGGFRSNWCRHNGVIYVKQTGGSPLTQLQLSLLAASSSSE